MTSIVDKLYKIDEEIGSAKEPATQSALYSEVLQSVKTDNAQAKKLASMIIPKYFKHFEGHQDAAINALLDLCEDDDIATRIYAIRALPVLCREVPTCLPKLADVLVQLLQADDRKELENVHTALRSLLRIDVKGTLSGLFQHLQAGEDVLRERAIAFLNREIVQHAAELLHRSADVEEHLAQLIRKTVEDVNGKEFRMFMGILASLKRYQTDAGVQELVDIVAEQAAMTQDFSPADPESVERLAVCLSIAVPLFGRRGSPSRFARYLAEQVLPKFDALEESFKVTLLKAVAELSPHVHADEARALLRPVYTLLLQHMPPKPAEGAPLPEIHFSFVEALLYAFHQIAPKCYGALYPVCGIKILTGQPSDYTGENHSAKLEDFKNRLQFLNESTQNYVKKLNQVVAKLKSEPSEDSKQKHDAAVVALRTTKNLQLMAQKLLTPKQPVFVEAKALSLSWKQPATPAPAPAPAAAAPKAGKEEGGKKAAAVAPAAAATPAKREQPQKKRTAAAAAATDAAPAEAPQHAAKKVKESKERELYVPVHHRGGAGRGGKKSIKSKLHR